jgi:chromosome segregation ATPase
MRSNMVDIQSKYEKQLTAVRLEKTKVQVAYDQAVQERQRLQEWVHEHMAATQERLLNSSAAVEASEKARIELQPRLETAESEVRGLKDQLRRTARESAYAQQQAAAQLEHLRSVAQAERGDLEAQVSDMATALEEQRKKTAAERHRREASDLRVESELEAARVAEQNAVHAIRDVKTELGTTLEHAELEIARVHREEMDRLRMENAKLEGQLVHSVRNYNQACDVNLSRMCKLTELLRARAFRRSKRRTSCRQSFKSLRCSSYQMSLRPLANDLLHWQVCNLHLRSRIQGGAATSKSDKHTRT